MMNPSVQNFRTDRDATERRVFPGNIGAYLDESANKFADNVLWRSIGSDQDVITFRQFQALTLRCARGFQARGVRRGDHVALMLPNVPAYLIAWIALVRLGAVAVAVNTASTSHELENVLRVSASSHLLIDAGYLDVYRTLALHKRLAADNVIIHGAPASDFRHNWSSLLEYGVLQADGSTVEANTVASIQFTSGSSGLPKACMLSHLYWMMIGRVRASAGPSPSIMLIDTPMYYMGPMWRFMMALDIGATLCVARRYSLNGLLDRLIDYKVEFSLVTNPVAKLPDSPRFRQTNLVWLTTYGLSKDLHEGLENRFGVPVREIYGMTEIGAGMFMPLEDRGMVGSGSCGRPAPFRSFRIVADGRDVAEGGEGELWVSGEGVFSGYYGQEDATAAAFEGQWFRTGDLFRRDRQGYYYVLGRIKDVIRRSGENISANEVELAVGAVPGVLEAAALPVPDDLRGEEIKIYVVLTPGTRNEQVAPKTIVNHCRNRIAPFKLPRYVTYVAEIPKTPTGKIDKNALKRAGLDLRQGSFDCVDNIWR